MGMMTLDSDNFKKHSAALLAGLMLFAITACGKTDTTSEENDTEATTSATTTQTGTFGFEDEPEENTSEYTVDNEDQAQKIITCSHRNLFGLEKIVLFENRMVAVFDKDTCDKSDCFLKKGSKKIQYVCLSTNNTSGIQPEFDLYEDNGKYILDTTFHCEESNLIDPARKVKITRFFVRGNADALNVEILADDLEISLYKDNNDSHKQYYDASEKTWSAVKTNDDEHQSYEYSEGITVSWSLDLANYWERPEYVIDGVAYKINGYGHYVSFVIENRSNETKTIGGTRYLQLVNDDDLVDLGRDSRESTIYYEGVIKDMPKVKIWSLGSSDPNQPWQRTPDPQFTLNENETFELEPGTTLYVEILAADFDIGRDGIYRLTFGEAQLDFELEWEMIW